MATPARVFQSFEAYEWDTEVFGALSLASRLAVSVKNKANVLKLAYAFHTINKAMNSLFDTFDKAIEGQLPVVEQTEEPVTPQRFRMAADNLLHLSRTLDYVYESCHRVGLLNNSLAAGSLRKMKSRSKELADIADWFELAAMPEQVGEIFDRAKQEKERGDLFDLSEVD